ncbi:MAG TPA: GNAT family N-acetyltransferase [Edaphobacter sp.]|uniref:GNAT family N-acetyltransferase n=1 Tax=Edaphobacter sp. TaxID=1934404 RepID=UPI002C52226F|nr:GNAT family N-acetyltransferase [Edaphobacter sp.]HUZ94066.1 GNAT family N-acetyltransferase [Edaphobacter sp.]
MAKGTFNMPFAIDLADIPDSASRENTSMPVDTLQLRPFKLADAAALRALNEAWIEKHFGLEELDREILGNPIGHIIEPGGFIYMACIDGRAVGCCALIPEGAGVYQIAKMAVDEQHRRRGIGRKLLSHVIEEARAAGATLLTLESSDKLTSAVHLYESLGFRHLPPRQSPFVRANVFMELSLTQKRD